MGARLLIVEDDDRMRAAMRLALEDDGYDVVESSSARAALDHLHRCPPDVMLLDLVPGSIEASGCIRDVRRDKDIPILVVSALAGTRDIVATLEAGADDYVTKPFEMTEISARLKALCRRARIGGGPERHQDLVLDADPEKPLVLSPGSAVVRRGKRDVHLTLTEYRLLRELASMPGHVLSRRTLVERVWEGSFFGDDRIIDVYVRRIRTKIERKPTHPRIVVTVRGYGYRLDCHT